MNAELTLTDLDLSDRRTLVTFRLDRQTYALPIAPIVQIIEMVTITPIPQVSSVVEGVINVRGAPVLVINLRRHLGLPESALQLHTPIILAWVDELMVGLIVDEVLDVLNLPGGQITRPAEILPEGMGEAPVLQGLAHTPDGMILLLDLDHLFLPQQVQALAQAMEILPEMIESVPGVEEGKESLEELPTEAAQPAPSRRKKRRTKKTLKGTASVEDQPETIEPVPGVEERKESLEEPLTEAAQPAPPRRKKRRTQKTLKDEGASSAEAQSEKVEPVLGAEEGKESLEELPSEAKPRSARSKRKKRRRSTPRQAQDSKASEETHLGESDQEVGT